jgi:hypothetical protein
MGYCIAFGKCVACPAIISFNPNKVPSIRVRWEQGEPIPDANGTREPLCRACAEAINADLRKKGETPPEIAADAYEGCPEEELEF